MYHADWAWQKLQEPFESSGYRFHPITLSGRENKKGRFPLFFTTLGEFAREVILEVQSLPPPIVFMGHSMGALVVARVIEKFRPAGVVLLAPASAKSFREVTIKFSRLHRKFSAKAFGTFNPRKAIATPEICREMFFSPELPPKQLLEYFGKLTKESYIATLQMLFGSLLRCPRYTSLPGLPVLLLGAENDWCVSRSALDHVAERLGVPAEILPNLAHDMMLDAQWESVSSSILEWLGRRR